MSDIGTDVSTWQGVVDWAKNHAACVANSDDPEEVFAFFRLGSINAYSGVCYEDYQFRRNAAEAPKYFDEVGVYWYFRPNHDPVKQANFIVDRLKEVYGPAGAWTVSSDEHGPYLSIPFEGRRVKLRIWIDVEETGAQTWTRVRDQVKRCIQRIFYRLYYWAGIYSRASFWNICVAPDPLWSTLMCWMARYDASVDHPWGDGKYKPRDWDDYDYWQFSADGNRRGREFGASGSHDIDINQKNPRQQPQPEPEPEPPVEVEEDIMLKVINGGGLNLRLEPSLAGQEIALIPFGENVELLQLASPARTGEVWAKIQRSNGVQGWAAYWYNGNQKLEIA